MKKQTMVYAGLALALCLTGFFVFKAVSGGTTAPVVPTEDEEIVEILPQVDASVVVDVQKSKTKENAVVMKVVGLAGKMASVGYELTYDSQGLIKGVNSGSKPIETTGQSEFEREIYLGTCSRNVCKPDVGVTKVSIAMEFTDKDGKKSQFAKDYDL